MRWDARPAPSVRSAEPLFGDDGELAPVGDWTARPAGISGGPVPGAPGFVFGNTLARLVAFLLDALLVFLAAAVLAAILANVLALDVPGDAFAVNALLYGLSTALSAAYFVTSWATSRRATPGMRAFGLQVTGGPEGTALTPAAGLVRWAVMGFPLALLLLVPTLAGVASLASLVVPVVLLASTRFSPARRGLHDRAAGSVVVQPETQEMTGALGCLVVVVAIVVVSVLAIAALLFLGGQIDVVQGPR
jgi:uncharacterized RDD family membrane protein YckC